MRAAFAVLRLRSAPGLTLALGVCAACARPAEGPLPGASEAWRKPPESAAPALSPPRPVWDAYTEVKRWLPANQAPFLSRGHQPEEQVDVRVNPQSLPIYRALVADSVFPDGSVLAELPHAAGGTGYGMRKEAGNWRFFELNAAGGVVSSGTLTLCAGCHAQAPADSVFGLPRVPAGAESPPAGAR